MQMFLPWLRLVLLFGLLLCVPLGVFPLPVLTLKKRLYLREQDTGNGRYAIAESNALSPIAHRPYMGVTGH